MKQKISDIILCIVVMAILVVACVCNFRDVENEVMETAEVTTEVVEATDIEIIETTEVTEEDVTTEEITNSTQEDISEEMVQLLEEELLQNEIEELLATMTLEEKVAQMFIITLDDLNGASASTNLKARAEETFASIPVGGIIFMENNLKNESQTKEILASLQEMSLSTTGLPLFLSVDEEGGSVARVAGNSGFDVTDVGDMADVGATEDPEEAYNVGVIIGSYLSDLGFNLDYAPVADVITNTSNKVIGSRSFGTDPDLVAIMVAAELEGLQSQNVYGTVKHFPGHGNTSGDTHKTTVVSDRTLEELFSIDLVPFAEAIEAGAQFIMVGHISLPNVTGDNTPATLSSTIVTDLLRERMGYDGIVITDAMNMSAITSAYAPGQAAVLAVQAGCDIILMPDDFQAAFSALLNAVESGEISEKRIDQSVERILKVKLQMEVMEGE